MSLTGFVDERVVFCDIEANGRMGREGAKWGWRCGDGLGGAETELWEGPASGEETYCEAAPSWERTEDMVRVAAKKDSEERPVGEGYETHPFGGGGGQGP